MNVRNFGEIKVQGALPTQVTNQLLWQNLHRLHHRHDEGARECVPNISIIAEACS